MVTPQIIVEDSAAATRPALEVAVDRIRARARRRVLWMSAFWAQAQGMERLAITREEVNRILDGPEAAAAEEEGFYRTDAEARRLSLEIPTLDLAFSRHPDWSLLRRRFDLSGFEIDLLSLAVAAALDPWLRRVYAYLQDDASGGGATPWLARELFQQASAASVSPATGLVKWRLARPAEESINAYAVHVPWVAEAYVLEWLSGRHGTDPVLGSSVQAVPRIDSESSLCLYPAQLSAMLEFVGMASEPAESLRIEIIGDAGAGKRTLAAQFAAGLGADLIAVDAETLLTPDFPSAAAEDRVMRCLRTAKLEGAVLYWHHLTGLNPRLWSAINSHPVVSVLGLERPSGGPKAASARRTIQLPVLRRDLRMALWERLASIPAPPIISDWVLSAADIVAGARIASGGPEAVAQVCQENLQAVPGELFSPLACPFTWDDIVLPYYLRQHLAELEQQVRLRWPVYEEWGFARLCPLGRGITALFSGPSGTGKTMAAQILARALGMRLFRVDLSGVVNKYIGETEKRLKQVFDACERANVLLFFDEADALFGQRTQVKDAHDRFANIEIDYLLQRMEQYDGVAILATNRKGDLDKAFVRRIRFIVDFVAPGPAERHALWRRCLLPRSPAGAELLDHIDWDLLANKLNMTGADITATALGAAFLACRDGARIGMSHVLHAARRQMNKQGIAIRAGELEP
jgi:hypothetical protein